MCSFEEASARAHQGMPCHAAACGHASQQHGGGLSLIPGAGREPPDAVGLPASPSVLYAPSELLFGKHGDPPCVHSFPHPHVQQTSSGNSHRSLIHPANRLAGQPPYQSFNVTGRRAVEVLCLWLSHSGDGPLCCSHGRLHLPQQLGVELALRLRHANHAAAGLQRCGVQRTR